MSKRPRLPLSIQYLIYISLFQFSTFQFAATLACLELKGFGPHSTEDLLSP